MTTSWVRSRASSLVRILLTWVLTVGRLTCSVLASSEFDRPRARSESTSRSRSVSCPKSRCRSGGTRLARLKCAISRRVTLGARSASPSATTRMALSSSSRGRLFSAKPLGPRTQRLEDVFVQVEGGQDEHPGRAGGPCPGDQAGCLDPVHDRHPDVHEDH